MTVCRDASLSRRCRLGTTRGHGKLDYQSMVVETKTFFITAVVIYSINRRVTLRSLCQNDCVYSFFFEISPYGNQMPSNACYLLQAGSTCPLEIHHLDKCYSCKVLAFYPV